MPLAGNCVGVDADVTCHRTIMGWRASDSTIECPSVVRWPASVVRLCYVWFMIRACGLPFLSHRHVRFVASLRHRDVIVPASTYFRFRASRVAGRCDDRWISWPAAFATLWTMTGFQRCKPCRRRAIDSFPEMIMGWVGLGPIFVPQSVAVIDW